MCTGFYFDCRCRRWVINCRRDDLIKRSTEYLSSNCNLCTFHFEGNQYTDESRQKLIKDAIPTIFDVPNPPKKVATKRKNNRERSPIPAKKPNKSRPSSSHKNSVQSCSSDTSASCPTTSSIPTPSTSTPNPVDVTPRKQKLLPAFFKGYCLVQVYFVFRKSVLIIFVVQWSFQKTFITGFCPPAKIFSWI